MKKTLFALGVLSVLFLFASQALAATLVTVTNGSGYYASNYLSFNDAKGVHLILDGVHKLVTITYPDQKVLTFPYSQTVSGLLVKGLWKGKDEWGYAYTASATETLRLVRHGGSGRGGGYHTHTTTIVGSGTISYYYAGAYAPPLVAPAVTGTSTTTSITLKWTAASGGVPPYTYSVYDQSGKVIVKTTGLTATIKGLTPQTPYTYTVLTIDYAGRQIKSHATTVYTLDD